MTLYEFIALDNAQRVITVQQHAIPIGEREAKRHRIKLYQLFGFYVEEFFNLQQQHITRYRPFSNGFLAPSL